MWLTHWRMSHLLADYHPTHSTWGDAEKLMSRWRGWRHYNGYPFSTLSDMNLATPKFEKRSAKLEAELTTKIQAHLMQAISKGHLPSITMTASIKDFVEHGDEDPNGNRIYIFYDDFLKWLTVSGFDYGMFRSDTLGFEEYEASELALQRRSNISFGCGASYKDMTPAS